jgi:uncharacterized membrane protein YqaE (UPF0057 family)
MADISVIRVSQAVFDRTVEDKTVEGWTVKTKGDRVAVLEKKGGWGSIVIHIILAILFFWTLFIPNIAYALYSYYGKAKELQIKVEDAV